MFVAWSAQGALYRLSLDSVVHRSADGATWAKATTVPGGRSQALGVGADGRVLVATAGGVFESRDRGATVTKLA